MKPPYPLSPAALEEIRRYVETGTRRHAVAGAPTAPSIRDIADHLFAKGLTTEKVNPGILWRACRRHGIALPGRPGRCRIGPARARKSKGTADGLPILEMQARRKATA